MYSYEIVPSLQKELNKLFKKDKKLYEIVMNKIEEILENPQHYKPLKYDFAGERRVHIMKSFVLKFEIDEQNKIIIFFFFGHHDEAYKR
ncbi:type II toxin-antitoxin system mRNA interferase toxin, RelE/StbE family [Candidatus Pacearchaeota archaeon]|nr:type II toxin-antitoxin system mRNA interferase toxin, RelE/StbE family [Candidatus Pacearchaeota archaeon]